MSKIESLRTYLHHVGPGEIPSGHVSEIERLLRDCWCELEIVTDDGNLEPRKLLNRTESLAWNEPFLTFEIERHGATVNGSVYAEIHTWSIDLENRQAGVESKRRRQVHPKDKRLNVKPLAQEIAELIVNGMKDERLRWKGTARVRVEISKAIPATNEQTTSGRRRRFRAELCRILHEHRWVMIGVNSFSRLTDGNSCAEPTVALARAWEPQAKLGKLTGGSSLDSREDLQNLSRPPKSPAVKNMFQVADEGLDRRVLTTLAKLKFRCDERRANSLGRI